MERNRGCLVASGGGAGDVTVENGFAVVTMPPGWFELPAEHSDEALDLIVAEIGTASPEAVEQLRLELAQVADIARGLTSGSRRSYALVLWPETGRVESLLSIRVVRTVPEGYENYLARAHSFTSDEHMEIVNRTVEQVALPYGPGVLSRDFSLPTDREGVPGQAMERTFLAVFPTGGVNAIEFTMLTHNLTLFEAAGEYLMTLAAGDDPTLAGTE